MSFLSAAFLLGLPFIGVPVAIHLLNRRRRTIIYWGATRFLQEAQTRRRSFLRLSDTLLMLLRALAVLLFILALARPQFEMFAAGGTGPRDVTFIVDNSMSTGLRDGGDTVYDNIVARTAELIDELNEADHFRLLLASHPPRWVAPEPRAPSQADASLALLRQAKPTQRAGNILNAIQTAAAIDDVEPEALRQIVIVSDGRAHGWQADSAVFWRALRKRLDSLTPPPVLRVVNVEIPNAARNLAVESLTTSRIRAGLNDTVRATAWLRNTGQLRTESLNVSLYVDGVFAGYETIDSLDPGDKTSVHHELILDELGPTTLEARIEAGDDLPLDNAASCLVEVVDNLPVLLVDGNTGGRLLETETGYLRAALGHHGPEPAAGWRAVFQPTVIADYELADIPDLESYACIVLANVPALPASTLQRLETFVRNGGGLWMALGDRTRPESFNTAFHDSGLAPLSVGEIQGEPTRGDIYRTVHLPNENHPALFLLADPDRLDVPRLRVYQHFALEDRTPETSVFFTTSRGDPLVAEGAHGKGRIILQAFPLTTDWTNVPACQAFVVMAREWLGYLAEPRGNRWNLALGEPIAVHLPGEDYEQEATLLTPGGEEHDLTASALGSEWSFIYRRTDDPGLYRLRTESTGGNTRTFALNIDRDAAESDLAPLPDGRADQLTELAGVEFGIPPLAAPTSDTIQTVRYEPLWTWLFISLLVLFLVEIIIAARLSRQRLGTDDTGNTPAPEAAS